MALVGFVILYFGLIIGTIWFGKWVLAACSILLGDKNSLHDCGSLCDDRSIPLTKDPVYESWKRNKLNNYRDNWRNRGEGNML